MRGLTKYKYCTLALPFLLISLTTLPIFSQAKHHNKHRPSAFVVGTVYCNTRLSRASPRSAHFISGATVSIDCNAFKGIAKTNKHGKFKLPIPPSENDDINQCQVSILKSSSPYCAATSATTSSSIRHVKPMRKQGPGGARSNGDGIESEKSLLDPITNGPLLGLVLPPLLGSLQPPSTPAFGFPGGVPGLPGSVPSVSPVFPIPFPPSVTDSARKASP